MILSRMKLPVSLLVATCQILSFFSVAQDIHSSTENASTQPIQQDTSSCVTYDSSENIIYINCKSTNLTGVFNELRNPELLGKESTDGIWLLNAGITIEKDSKLYINSTDVRWLKMIGDGANAHAIRVHGSLMVDSVKISSWNPETNDYLKLRAEKKIPSGLTEDKSEIAKMPRPYLFIDHAKGNTNITKSEIAYLGYDCNDSNCHGLVFYESKGNMIRDNNIHHNHRGFYSSKMGNTILENNHVHNNYEYGIDPHTATHDLIIRNNSANNNGGIGIICSLDCYNIVMEENTVYNNVVAGMMLSRNTSTSIIRNNNILDESMGISISQSHNNEIYNNTLSDVKSGIDVKKDSSQNIITDNTIEIASDYGFRITDDTGGNILESNTIIGVPHDRAIMKEAAEEERERERERNNVFIANKIISPRLQQEQL
jgi:mannuronan 5-epimerase